MKLMTWAGDYWIVIVTCHDGRCGPHALPNNATVGNDLAVGLHAESAKARRELLRLLRVADSLATFVDQGGHVEKWIS